MTASPSSPSTLLRVRTPADIVVAVPYLLGFHPFDSLVLLGMGGKRLVFHARIDLLDADAKPSTVDLMAEHLVDMFVARGAEAVILVGYGAPERVTPLVLAAQRILRRRELSVLDALRVADGRYWSYICANPDCCSPAGTPYDSTGSAIAAQATFAGCEVLPDREAVVHSLDPPVRFALAAIRQATDRAVARLHDLLSAGDVVAAATSAARAALDEAWARYEAGERLDDDELAWLTVLLMLHLNRDIAWLRIDAEWPAGRPVHQRLFSDLVRRCDPAYAAPPAMLLAYTMWRAGDGVRATIAVERALRADPDYSAGQLMAEVLRRGVPPSALTRPRGGRSGRPGARRPDGPAIGAPSTVTRAPPA